MVINYKQCSYPILRSEAACLLYDSQCVDKPGV